MRWTVVAVMGIMQLLYNGNVSLVHNASNNISRIDVYNDFLISGSEDVVNYTNHQINLFQILLDVMNKHIPPCKSIFGLLITLLSEKAYIMNVWYAREKVRWSIDSRLIRLIILLSSSTCIYIRYFMVNKVHSIFDVTTTFWNIIQRRIPKVFVYKFWIQK